MHRRSLHNTKMISKTRQKILVPILSVFKGFFDCFLKMYSDFINLSGFIVSSMKSNAFCQSSLTLPELSPTKRHEFSMNCFAGRSCNMNRRYG